ncbi:MAG: phage terminase large subunit [Oscillospiraceae bacterium]|nr:phage terminase large subunit [Oscillospiraceae bacterium]
MTKPKTKSKTRDLPQTPNPTDISKILGMIIESKIPDYKKDIVQMLENMQIPDGNFNIMTAMLIETAKKAMSGDLKSLEWILGILGLTNKNPDENQLNYHGLPANLVGRSYVDIYREIRERKYRYYDFKGGRGSLKSSFCALVLIDEIMRNNNFCAIALRQIKDTLSDSVYSQLKWAIDKLNLNNYFKFTVSPLQITRIDTGQIIYFRGCDEPVKIKSIKPPGDMHIGVIWFEEKDQLNGQEAVRNIQQSVMRGGGDIIVLSSYNTPISRKHFLNLEENLKNNNKIIHHSYYYDSPKEWLGQPFLDEAEYLKSINLNAYKHEYLGEAIGEGGSVFENIEIREFNKTELDEINRSDRFYYGVDWGFYPDIWAYVKCCYAAKDRTLYITDEAGEYKKSNKETSDILINQKKLTKNDMIICDSSEPKSIGDYISAGLYARAAEKGAGSVSYSMRWLQGLNKIIIDAKKCPKTAREFSEYEYEKDANGEIITGYPDKNNHFIDAARYAANLLWRRQ